jgi:hypothetical protein
MAALCEQRDRAMTRRLNVQNRITRGELIPRDTVKLTLGRISGSWSSVIPEASRTISPIILAILGSKDPTADSRLRLLIDDEAYSAGGHANEAMEKWLSSRKTDEAE